MIQIEHGPTSDGRYMLRVDGQIVATDDKAGVIADEVKRQIDAADEAGAEYQVSERYWRVTVSKGGNLPGKADAPTEAVDVAGLLKLSIGKLKDALATGAYDDELDELHAGESMGKGRAGAVDAIEDRASEIGHVFEPFEADADTDGDE